MFQVIVLSIIFQLRPSPTLIKFILKMVVVVKYRNMRIQDRRFLFLIENVSPITFNTFKKVIDSCFLLPLISEILQATYSTL
jgi:hypothetical protein